MRRPILAVNQQSRDWKNAIPPISRDGKTSGRDTNGYDCIKLKLGIQYAMIKK